MIDIMGITSNTRPGCCARVVAARKAWGPKQPLQSAIRGWQSENAEMNNDCDSDDNYSFHYDLREMYSFPQVRLATGPRPTCRTPPSLPGLELAVASRDPDRGIRSLTD